MTGRHLGMLIVIAVVAIAAAFWTSAVRESAPRDSAEFVPGLADRVNDVIVIRVYSSPEQPAVTLSRGEQYWQVEQKAGYRADNAEVKKLLLSLGEADLIEEKTSNPELYDRLGVQDVSGGNNVMLELDGVATPGLIIGDGVAAREATYVRRADETTSWLADSKIEAASDPKEWLDHRIVDIDTARIAQVDIHHPDGEHLSLTKDTFGQSDFDVQNIPEGRELKRANIANPLANALKGLNFDDVVTTHDFELPEPVIRAEFRTYDGLVVRARLATTDEQYYARFEASTDPGLPAKYQDAARTDAGESAADDEAAETTPASDVALPAPDMSEAVAEAARLNAVFDSWVYVLPKYKYEQLTRRLEFFLAALPAEGD